MVAESRMKKIKADYEANIVKLQKYRFKLEQAELNRIKQNETIIATKAISPISDDEETSTVSSSDDELDEPDLPNTNTHNKKPNQDDDAEPSTSKENKDTPQTNDNETQSSLKTKFTSTGTKRQFQYHKHESDSDLTIPKMIKLLSSMRETQIEITKRLVP